MRWRLLDVALVAFASFVAALAVSVALVIVLGISRRSPAARGPEELVLLTVAQDGILVVVLYLLARARLGLRARDLGLRRPSLPALRDALLLVPVLFLASIAVNLVASRIFGEHPQDLVRSVGAHTGLVAYALDLLTGGVMAPFAEEIFFRGLIFGALVQRMPLWAAAGGSGLLFAAFHGLGSLFPILVLGIGLAYVYARTGTLWASMATHAGVNALSLTILFLAPRT